VDARSRSPTNRQVPTVARSSGVACCAALLNCYEGVICTGRSRSGVGQSRQHIVMSKLREFNVGFSVGLARCPISLFPCLFPETPRQSKLYTIHNLNDSNDEMAELDAQTSLH
jgi:hypothetical protein